MKKEILDFIKENNLSPFKKSAGLKSENSIFKTRDAKVVYQRVLDNISSYFLFDDTKNILKLFYLSADIKEIENRQDFFRNIPKSMERDFLVYLKEPKVSWKPRYQSVVVTENENTLAELKNLGCPVKFIINQDDINDLHNYDVVQVIDCDESKMALERLPQTIFIDSIDEVYLERFIESLSAWKHNIEVLKGKTDLANLNELINYFLPLLNLAALKDNEEMNLQDVESLIELANKDIELNLKNMMVSGESLLSMLNKNSFPNELKSIINNAISKFNLDSKIIEFGIPLKLDETEFEKIKKEREARQFTDELARIIKYSEQLKNVPSKILEFSSLILYFDFISGMSDFIKDKKEFPLYSSEFLIKDSYNILLENPAPISFCLNENIKCSILTGANSGGKTTFLEHIIQLITLSNLGLPVSGSISIPVFTDVYYFAKNKGSASKGAFETLLSQMASIKPGEKTLILADEIESVTEPGVAGKIICATAEYFIKKGCFIVIATHLGQEIQKYLPYKARIDGIEAKGLDEKFELIVDHNPILGKLARSTPELIVEKMASALKDDYYIHLYNYLKGYKKI